MRNHWGPLLASPPRRVGMGGEWRALGIFVPRGMAPKRREWRRFPAARKADEEAARKADEEEAARVVAMWRGR